jgi:hypothetical protein
MGFATADTVGACLRSAETRSEPNCLNSSVSDRRSRRLTPARLGRGRKCKRYKAWSQHEVLQPHRTLPFGSENRNPHSCRSIKRADTCPRHSSVEATNRDPSPSSVRTCGRTPVRACVYLRGCWKLRGCGGDRRRHDASLRSSDRGDASADAPWADRRPHNGTRSPQLDKPSKGQLFYPWFSN